MKIEIEIPSKYATRLKSIEKVEPSILDQIEIEILPSVLRLINDAHRQLEEQESRRLVDNTDSDDR